MSFLARNLRYLRKLRKEKQEDISVLFGKKANTVGNWENRKSEPSVGEIVRLAEHFGIGLNDLLNADLSHQSSRPAGEGHMTVNPRGNNNVSERREPQALGGRHGSAASPTDEKQYQVDYTAQMNVAESTDSFWVLIRELRTIHEKLDELKDRIASMQERRGSDKSEH